MKTDVATPDNIVDKIASALMQGSNTIIASNVGFTTKCIHIQMLGSPVGAEEVNSHSVGVYVNES